MKQMLTHNNNNKTVDNNQKSSAQKFVRPSSNQNYVQQLHSSIGNQAVQKLLEQGSIQAKLTIGSPNDKYEQEADRVAEQVMNMPEQAVVQRQAAENELIQSKTITNTIKPVIQRQEEEEEEVQPGYDQEPEDLTPILESVPTGDADELAKEEEEFIQPKSNTGTMSKVTPGIAHAIHSIKGAGQPLPASERAFFEPRFGTDFSNVRVHTGEQAARTAQSINARAFTLGRDVVFGAGQYSLGSLLGRSLLAHELTHVVQQNQGGHTHSNLRSRNNPHIQVSANKTIIQRNGPNGAGWVKEEYARAENVERKKLERYANAGSTISRMIIKKTLYEPLHLKFVNWCESSAGENTKAFLQYLKNTKHTVSCWPNDAYPYEVNISGPTLKLKSNYPWWPSKVEKAAISYEPRIRNPHMYAYHVSLDKFSNLQPEMKDLIDRYSGFTTSNVPVVDKRLLTHDMVFTRPSYVKWKHLSNEMRVCWRAALSEGKSVSGKTKGIAAFQNQANALHNSILAGLKYVYAEFNNPRKGHEFKKLVYILKSMASDNNSAMYSYRKDIKVGLLTKWMFKIKKWVNPLKK